jgi:hypothetical protein
MTLVGPFVKAEVIRKGFAWYAIRVYKTNDLVGSETGDAPYTRWGAKRKADKWLRGERTNVVETLRKDWA